MKALKIFLCIIMGCVVASPLYADIYEWTDKDGVTHYTNYAPPPEAKIIMKTEELPYDVDPSSDFRFRRNDGGDQRAPRGGVGVRQRRAAAGVQRRGQEGSRAPSVSLHGSRCSSPDYA